MLRMPQIIFRNKFLLPSLPPPGTFKDKKVLITGASSGLGLAAAVHYINLGASLVSFLFYSNLNVPFVLGH
jgi:NADPH:quinone reductase-like Zn-dependent oxidoreductase